MEKRQNRKTKTEKTAQDENQQQAQTQGIKPDRKQIGERIRDR